MKEPPRIELEDAELEQLIGKAEQGSLNAAEQQRLVPLLKTLLWLEHTLLQTRISLANLKRLLFGSKTEKVGRKPTPPEREDNGGGQGSDEGGGPNESPGGSTDGSSGQSPGGQAGASNGNQRRGHGRRAAADYPGAQTVGCAHADHQRGDRCPLCARGRLYRLPPLVQLRFQGQPLGLAIRYALERLRCGGCGAVFVAPLPPEAGPEVYATSLKVNLAVTHFHLGLPLKRIESFQDLLGMCCIPR